MAIITRLRSHVENKIINFKEPTKEFWTIDLLSKNLNDDNIDFSPPYQRGMVWRDEPKEALIQSLLCGIPIGIIHLVKKSNEGSDVFVLDAKQRLGTIRDFLKSEFSIKLFDTEKSENIELKWKEMKNSSDKVIRDIAHKFLGTQLNILMHPPMEMMDQVLLFKQINFQSQLSINEKIYCENFYAKFLFEYLFDYKEIKRLFQQGSTKNFKENYRFEAIRMIHNICCLCFGKDLQNKMYSYIGARKEIIESSARVIHDKIINIGFRADKDKISDEILKKIGIYDNIKWLKRISESCNNVLNYYSSENLSKKLSKVDMEDIIFGMIRKIQEGIITIPFIQENLGNFNTIFFEFLKMKNLEIVDSSNRDNKYNKKHREGTQNHQQIQERQRIWDNVFVSKFKEFKMDLGKKNRELPRAVKTQILRDAKSCAGCGVKLINENFRADHINNRTISSDISINNAQPLCNYCNDTKKGSGNQENLTKKNNKLNSIQHKHLEWW